MFAQMRLALQVGRMLGDQPDYERKTTPEDVSLTTRQAPVNAVVVEFARRIERGELKPRIENYADLAALASLA